MPRYRAIYIVWLLGLVLLVGVWMQSVFHKTVVLYADTAGTARSLWLGDGAIALEVSTSMRGVSRWFVDTTPASFHDKSLFFGKFHWGDASTSAFSPVTSRRLYQVPFWFLIVLFTLLCVPLMLRANRRYNQARAAQLVSPPSEQ